MNLPGRLVVLRTTLIPVSMLVLILNFPTGSFNFVNVNIPFSQILAVVIFAGASYTDCLDGRIAKARRPVTNSGKFADPLADRMLVMTAFVFLISMGKASVRIMAIIVCRELVVTGLCLVLVGNSGGVLAVRMPGKTRTATQMLSIISLLLGDIFFIGTILSYICLIFTIYPGWDYFY